MTMTIHADYQAFYQRVQSKPDETVYSEIEEGLDRMAGGKSVVHITDLILYYHFVNNPTIPGMHIFAEGRPTMKGPLLTKNSPLGIADLNHVWLEDVFPKLHIALFQVPYFLRPFCS